MSWETVADATQLTNITTEQVFQRGGVDWVITLRPGEQAILMLKAADAGSTDDIRFTVYETIQASPGDVPDSGQTLAGSGWARWGQIVHDTSSSEDNVWITHRVSGVYKFAVTAQRHTGSTDTIDSADMKVILDGVSLT